MAGLAKDAEPILLGANRNLKFWLEKSTGSGK